MDRNLHLIYTMNLGRYLRLGAIVFCSTFGDVAIAHGMKNVGAVSIHHLDKLLFAVLNPWVGLGTLLLIGFFWSYLSALSWADLSYVMPATAFGHVLTVVSAKIMLHEYIPLTRWIGVFLISFGVGVIARGPSLTIRPEAILPLEHSPEVQS